jgi:hypothetical protein
MTRDLSEMDDFPRAQFIVVDNLVEELKNGESLNIDLEEIEDVFLSVETTKGTTGSLHYRMDEFTRDIFNKLDCTTLKDAVPYLLAHRYYLISDEDRDQFAEFAKKYEIAQDEVMSTPNLKGCFEKLGVISFLATLVVYGALNNSKKNLSNKDESMIQNSLESMKNFEIAKDVRLKYSLKKVD